MIQYLNNLTHLIYFKVNLEGKNVRPAKFYLQS